MILKFLKRRFSFFVISLLTGCSLRPVERSVSESVQITKEWVEIRPLPPLKVEKQVQEISLSVPDVSKWDISPDGLAFLSPTGEKITIDVELFATDGTRFALKSIGLGPGLVFSYSPKDKSSPIPRLPADKKFNLIRIRSDRNLFIENVKWNCITNY